MRPIISIRPVDCDERILPGGCTKPIVDDWHRSIRQRTATEVQLVRHDLDAAETAQFLDRLVRTARANLKGGFRGGVTMAA